MRLVRNVHFLWDKLRDASPFAGHAAINAVANVLLAGLGLASGVLAARMLGPGGRGELAAIQTWPTFLASLAMVGLPDATAYYSAREPGNAGCYLMSAILLASIFAAPFMLVGYALVPLMLHAQRAAIVQASRWYLLLVPMFILTGIPRYPLQGRGDFVPWNVMRIAPNVLWIAVLGLAWLLTRAVPTFVAAANLIALASLVVPFAILVRRRIPGPFTVDRRKWPLMIKFGLPCMMTMAPQVLNARLDQMLMAALLPPRDLGLYVVAVAWSGAVAPLLSAVSTVTMPAVASAADEGQRVRRFTAASRVAAALALVLCVGLIVVTPFAIVVFFGEAFKKAIPAALVLIPAAAVLGLNAVLEEGLRGLGRPYSVLRAELTGLAITAIGLAAMLRPMAIMGAAIASLAGYSTVTIVLLFGAWRCTGISPGGFMITSVKDLRLRFGIGVASPREPAVNVD
jgi:O-antigen/teichoic acid export membrane protein